MKKIAVITDSSADISIEYAKQKDLFVVRLPIVINDTEEFIEEVSLTKSQLAHRMTEGDVPKTSQAVIGDLYKMFTDVLREYDEALYFPISSGLSGSYQTACTVAEDFDGRITVVDSKFVCYPYQLLLQDVQTLLNTGNYTCAQIKEKVENETFMWAALLPRDLVYLKRGGRMSAAAAALGNLLKIIPIIKVENGCLDVYDKVRTWKKAVQVAMDACASIDNKEDYHFYVVEAELGDLAEEYRVMFEEAVGQPVTMGAMYSTIMAHTGPETIAFGYCKKLKG